MTAVALPNKVPSIIFITDISHNHKLPHVVNEYLKVYCTINIVIDGHLTRASTRTNANSIKFRTLRAKTDTIPKFIFSTDIIQYTGADPGFGNGGGGGGQRF